MERIKEALRGGLPCNSKGYLESYQENIFQGYMPDRFRNMFMKGSGSELRSKAEAVHSSSMLAYNFFHWVSDKYPLTIDDIKYTQVFFEVKMEAITTDANMDILLIDKSRKRLLFIESKFLEYLNSKKYDLKDAYREQDGWKAFLSDVDKIVPKDNDNSDYQEGIKQGVTHLFALSELKEEKAFKHFNETNGLDLNIKSIQDANDIKFINLLFEPNGEYDYDYKRFDNYIRLYRSFKEIAQQSGIVDDILMKILTYSELWHIAGEQIKKVNQGHLYQYLEERYMRFAGMQDNNSVHKIK